MRLALRYQILAPFAALVVVAVLGLTVLNAYLGARRVAEEIEQQLRQVARTLLDSSFPLNDVVLSQMHGLSGAHYAVVDERGIIRTTSVQGRDLRLPATNIQEKWDDLTLQGPIVAGNQQVFYMALRMGGRRGSAEPAILQILYPVRSYREACWAALYPSLGFGLAVVAVAIALSAWIAQRLSKPIQQVCSHMGRLAAGDFTEIAIPQRNDELNDLVQSMNWLSRELKTMRAAIAERERLAVLGQLSAGMVHHLRNDVTGTRIAVQLHQRTCNSIDRESLDVALRQLTLTEEHLQRFLAAGRPLRVERSECDLGSVLRDIARLLGPTMKHRRIMLDVRVPSEQQILSLDAGQLRQATIALLLNAMDAVGQGGAIEVVQERLNCGDVRISIRDSGPGLTTAAARRMFEPFFTTKPEGVGLGLTAARQIAMAHGGRLEYARCNGQTIFDLILPSSLDGRICNAEALIA